MMLATRVLVERFVPRRSFITWQRFLFAALVATSISCGDDDAGYDGAVRLDAAMSDARLSDAAAMSDTPATDAPMSDTSRMDARGSDAGSADAGASDGGNDARIDSGDALLAAFTLDTTGGLSVNVDASESRGPITDYAWDFGDGSIGSGVTASHTYARGGCYVVGLTLSSAGDTASASESVQLSTAGGGNVNVMGLPGAGSFLTRGRSMPGAALELTLGGDGLLAYNQIVARTIRDGATHSEVAFDVCDAQPTAILEVEAVRSRHRIEVVGIQGVSQTTLASVDDVVAGDLLVIAGQSNAVSYLPDPSPGGENVDAFVRAYEGMSPGPYAWYEANPDGPGYIGNLANRFATMLSRRVGVPIAVLTSFRGGRPIEYFQRNDANPVDLDTNYGQLLHQVRDLGVTDRVRAIVFYQGEHDGARGGAHRDGYTALQADWREDYPGIEEFYVTQIRQGGCGGSIEVRDVQRRFATTLPDTTVMSTTGIDEHDGCHYAYGGYRTLGDRYADILARDLYGDTTHAADVEAVDVASAVQSGSTIRITTRSDATALQVDAGTHRFEVLGAGSTVVDVRAQGTDLVLTLSGSGSVNTVRYLGRRRSGAWITNARGVGLLSFSLGVM